MEFRETLLAAQRNQQQKSSERTFYKTRFDPPKKEQKCRDRLSANIQKFLAKKEEEERQKKLDAQRKKEEFMAMRDPKALRKIQKTLKVIKSANKSVLADAIDRDHTAVTLQGPDQPDQDDYGYESQEAAALYQSMMQKYSKIPDEPKFSPANSVSRDLNGTRERVKHALQHEDEHVPHKRRGRGTENEDRELSPPQKYEPERKKSEKSEKPKTRKPAPPPIDFNQLLKLAEQKKSEPIDIVSKKVVSEPEPDRLMTKKQKREYDEEMARRQRRQERIEAAKAGRKAPREEKSEKAERTEKEKRPEPVTQNTSFGRIPKLGDRNSSKELSKTESPKTSERERDRSCSDRDRLMKERERMRLEKERFDREKERYNREKERYDREKEKFDREKEKARLEREKDKEKLDKERLDRERLEKLKAERDRIDREMEKLARDREILEKNKVKLELSKSTDKIKDKIVDRSKTGSRERDVNKSIDLKSQNTYRIDKNANEKKLLPQRSVDPKLTNGHNKPVPKLSKESAKNQLVKKPIDTKVNGQYKDKRVDNSRIPQKKPDERATAKPDAGTSKPMLNSFDFDKHVNSLNKNGSRPVNGKRRGQGDRKTQKRRKVDSDSEYDSEMDDFIDDGDEDMDYSTHIKEIFGYDKAKYRDMDDDDDPTMESSFARQQREEYISKKIGIMEDLEDMRMEAKQKSKGKKRRRISDD